MYEIKLCFGAVSFKRVWDEPRAVNELQWTLRKVSTESQSTSNSYYRLKKKFPLPIKFIVAMY